MRVLGLAIGAAMVVTAHAAAADARFEKSLQRLAPNERLEQLCDYTAMVHIRNDQRHFRPDRAVANAISDPQQKNHTIIAKGAAFRSRGKWYALSFACTAEPDHLKIESFHYTVGKEIPQAKWAAYGLWQ
jgi:hypothetical protein